MTACSSVLDQIVACAGDAHRGVGIRGMPQPVRESGSPLWVGDQCFEDVGNRRDLPIVFACPGTARRRAKGSRIGGLMILAGGSQRNDESRQPRRGKLGKRDRTGRRDREVGPRVVRDDVVEERRDLGCERAVAIGDPNRVITARTGLVADLQRTTAPHQLADDFRDRSIQKRRAQRTAEDQYPYRPRPIVRTQRTGLTQRGPNRDAGNGHPAPAAERRGRLWPAEENRVGETGEQTVAQPGGEVRFADRDRQAAGPGRENRPGGSVAPERQQRLGPGVFEYPARGAHPGEGVDERPHLSRRSRSEQGRARNELQGKPRGRHELAFETELRTEKENLRLRRDEAIRTSDGERRVDVPSRPAADDGETSADSIGCFRWNRNLPRTFFPDASLRWGALLSCTESG